MALVSAFPWLTPSAGSDFHAVPFLAAVVASQFARLVPISYGPLELSLPFFYQIITVDGSSFTTAQGILVVLVYRIVLFTVCLLTIGAYTVLQRLSSAPSAATSTVSGSSPKEKLC